MPKSPDSKVVSIHESIVAKNTPALSESTGIIVEHALAVLRLSGMKNAHIIGIDDSTGDPTCEIRITYIAPKETPTCPQ